VFLARGDRERPKEQGDAALGLYRELGMQAWAARASALR
jgi:hypothetical protein